MKSFLFERNFLILLSSVFINGVGSGVYAVSGMLLVLHLSGSVLYSGFAFFSITLANAMAFLIAPLTKYFTYKRGLFFSSIMKSALLFSIPLFYITVGLNVYYVLIVLFLVSLLAQFSYPIETTITPIIVGKENLIKANSYIQTIREAMDIVFLAAAGILVVLLGSVQAIFITAVCHLLSSLTYTLYTFPQNEVSDKQQSFKKIANAYTADLMAGLHHMKNSLIPKMIFSVIFINIAMGVMMPNLPAFALIKGNGNEAVYGFYLAAMSTGVLIGTMLTPRVKQINFGQLTISTFIGTGILWTSAAFLPVIPSLIMFSLGAVSIGIINIFIFTAIQQQVEPSFIGRVVTVLTSASSIGMPFGALAGGFIGETFTAVIPVALCGLSMLLFSVIWLSSSVLRKLPKIEETNFFPVRESAELQQEPK
ncbi:MFS transporter [Alkalicoccus daliensis]|uniref:Transmembrane secretion effector n=1 Tax=Alkalicoccus daliensis TaxID=745820 RepID=A0A1H0D5C6_9BACI|nr:MFS transporter [Alkalicoccus daliensis]SDN65380.1 Transmembrane secretion effector [Alkalicoccus daliensis]